MCGASAKGSDSTPRIFWRFPEGESAHRFQFATNGVDTKLIEGHRGLLGELLDAVLPASTVDFEATGVRHFTRRYGLDRLADIPWLQATELHYRGDIDAHGFAILNRLRATLPRTRSLLMDRATLQAHRHLWVQEPADQRFTGHLDRLTADEQQLYAELRDDHHGERVRLEQKRIAYGELLRALAALDVS